MPLYERNFEPRCHICSFLQVEPEWGELFEAWILDPLRDNQEAINKVNGKFGWNEDGEEREDWHWLDLKKVRTHLSKHITDRQEIFARARQQGLTGNITLESAVIDQMTMLQTLSDSGMIKVANGQIQVENLSDLMRVMDYQHKIMGGEKVEIKVGGSGGLNIPPQLLTAMIGVMKQFVPQHQFTAFRQKLDEEVFPVFKRYAENWQDQTGEQLSQIPETVDGTAIETQYDPDEAMKDNNNNGRG